jgi:two-component system, chemotaxis family, sensor kinase CheA
MTDKQQAAFREEAYELLVELESALLELDRSPEDGELIQRTFRALHTIKGSGSMFGFDEIARFTHELETAFDRVREGALPVSAALVNLTLAGRDQIKAMLDESSRGGVADPRRSAEIIEKLCSIVGTVPDARPARPAAPPFAAPGQVSGPDGRWRIRFSPARDTLIKGTNPLLLIRELGGLGELKVAVLTDDVPDLAQLDPESCYLRWDLELKTSQAREAIRDVFIFVEDDCELSIEPLETAEAAPAAPEAAVNAAEPASGVPAQAESAAAVEPWTLGSVDRRNPRSVGAAASIRVAAEKLDSLVNVVGELVIVQARLTQLASRRQDPEMQFIAEEVERLMSGLRDNAMSIRMLPLRGTFDRFRRLVHDLTRDLGKEVEFTTDGAETELDKTVIDQLNDPLLHLIRNSMDHGIEAPEVRLAASKPRAGTIHLSATHQGAHVLIRVADDGRGLDVAAVRARAVEKGLIPPDAELSESEVFSLILSPGFSTARQVTDLSGRGVGMDVVRRSIDALRGSIDITSTPGAGMVVTLRLPLTLAIIDGLLIRVAGACFVIPLSNVLECVELSREEAIRGHDTRLANVRGELIPYIRLREHFRIHGEPPDIEQIMIVETDEGRHGFAVDEVLGDHQTVIKGLGRFYSRVHEISGATILGDGAIALILDPQRLVQNAIRSAGKTVRYPAHEVQTPEPEEEEHPQPV